MKGNLTKVLVFACLLVLGRTTESLALSVTQTTTATDLASALGGGGNLTINSVSITNGADSQFGTYTGFTSPPITLGDGVVLSTGDVTQTPAGSVQFPPPTTTTNAGSTTEFTSYGIGHITNFTGSYDVAALTVNFTLASPSQVGFQFVFGSGEYPLYLIPTNLNFTDAFLVFLDGTGDGNQIAFNGSGPVAADDTFANAQPNNDTNTIFGTPFGLVKLQTLTDVLAAGDHTIIFEIGDVKDATIDSAVFISDFHAATNPIVPVPPTVWLLGSGLLGLAGWRRLRRG